MTEPLERDEVIGLLNSLGSERDEDVLEAARQAHAKITAAGMTWEDLLVPDDSADDTDDADDADDTDYAGETDHADDTGDADDTDDADETDETDETDDTGDAGDTADQDLEKESSEPRAENTRKNAESLALIDKLLTKSGISTDLREDLNSYKTDIAEGEFDEGDRRYLRAISERLSKRR